MGRIFKIQSQSKLNVCFLLKHNIGNCVVHLNGCEHIGAGMSLLKGRTLLYQKVYRQEAGEGEGEAAGEDGCHPSGYNRRRSIAAVS